MGPPSRQHEALDDLLRRAGQLADVEAVILIGSLASATADGMSDVDAVVVLAESSFERGRRQRHRLHARSILASPHPIEAAYDDLKEAVRGAREP